MGEWRRAVEGDDPAIIELCLGLYREDPSPVAVDEQHIMRTLATFRAEPTRGKVVVLEVDGRVVGYSLLASFWSNELGGATCVIDELYVAPLYRSQGYSSALVAELREGGLWDERPIALCLEVTPTNARAMALYKRLGFDGKNVNLRLSLG
jgi:ribosomal protein S18 acetylase RimI-like enzyme